jgi:pyruvate/2-oxoglutarate dehydrogenase complex dihydrolipoamide dehydrogenase (E3) component
MDERGYIIVDDNFKTGVEGIWAIGDVIGGMMFTHKARNDSLLLARNMFKGEQIHSKDRLVPFSIFTEPEIAGIGLGEAAAISAGYKIKVQRFPFGFLGRAMAIEKTTGFVKLILEAENGKILGAHIIGPEAGELIHELIMAMYFGATVNDLQDMIHVHPTLAETIFSASWSKK